jgi:hypothetical protein
MDLSYDKPGFSKGRMVSCGAEAWLDQTNIAVQCSQMISIASILILAIVIMLFVLFGRNFGVVRAGPPLPTAAPSVPTPGPRQPIPEFNGPYLDKLLDEQAALKLAVEVDKENAIWEKSWGDQARAGKSDRVSIKWYPKCNFEGEGVGPGVECGPVWVISFHPKTSLV